MKILLSRTYWFILVASILLISVCYTLPQPLFAADNPTIFVADEPAGKATDTVTLNMTDSASVTLPLYLSQSITSTTVLTNVRLLGHLADEAGQALSNAQIAFATVENDTEAISFTIPAGGKQLLVNVTVTNLPTNGEFQGYLSADFDGYNEKISKLTVRNFPKPEVNLVGITTYQSTSAAYHQRFQLVTENQTDVDDLRVQIAPFIGPDSQQVGTSWIVDGKSSAESIKVAGLSAATLEISATLPTTGTYTSNSSLIYDGLRHPITFTVERIQPTLSPLPLEVTGIATSEGYLLPSWLNHRFQSGSFRFGLGWSKDVSVWMTLRATNNEPLTLNIPTIVTMTRQGKDDTQLQATVVEQVSNDSAIVLTGTDTISLKPGMTQRVNLALLDLSRTGLYKGAIRFGGPNASPIQRVGGLEPAELRKQFDNRLEDAQNDPA